MKKAIQDAVDHALREYPKESCGIVIMEGGEEVYIPCENASLNPTHMFTLGGEDYLRAQDRGRIVEIVHSHPDGSCAPSDADRRACEVSKHPWRILAIHRDTGGLRFMGDSTIQPSGYAVPLVGREFVHGVLDCFTLIRDYYKMRLDIELPDFPREDDWWKKGGNLYLENYEKAGFAPAETSVREHDVVLMQVRARIPNHGGIYVGDTRMLHHLHSQLSRIDLYSGYWQSITTHVLRHRQLK